MRNATNGFSQGFSTALPLWLFFLFCFFFLGYPVPLSILLGAIGGLAGGWIVGWWNSKDEQTRISELQEEEESEEAPIRLKGLRSAKKKRDASYKRRLLKATYDELNRRIRY
ncbi:hypothetical protein [Lyngbya aestuarii]|uniref:hypothetical protein n=1 Tax=Lyngbya aestuarii TaxID=118322 RepID=UPI00403DA244